MEVGKLYKNKQYYWMLYRSEDDTNIFRCTYTDLAVAQFWSTRRQNIPYIPPNSFFLLLEQKDKYCKVLSPEGDVGWIHLADCDWCRNDIEEVKVE